MRIIYIYIYIYFCIYIYMYIQIHTYICIHIYIHTKSGLSLDSNVLHSVCYTYSVCAYTYINIYENIFWNIIYICVHIYTQQKGNASRHQRAFTQYILHTVRNFYFTMHSIYYTQKKHSRCTVKGSWIKGRLCWYHYHANPPRCLKSKSTTATAKKNVGLFCRI